MRRAGRHAQADQQLLQERAKVYELARQESPHRWSAQTRHWQFITAVHLNPDRPPNKESDAAGDAAQLKAQCDNWLDGFRKWAVNQASTNQQDVRRTPVPWPPAAEQFEIARALDDQLQAAGKQRIAIELAFKQSAAQRQNMLRAAFAGQLLPQDPAHEPAGVLLKRIRAGWAAAGKPAKARRPRTAQAAAGPAP